MSIIAINKKTKAKHVIALFVLIFIGNLSTIFMFNLVGYQSIDQLNSYNNDVRDVHPKSQGIVQDDHTIEWLDNPTFETPITPWYNTTEGDASDINATTDFNQANYKILGDLGVLQVDNALSNSDWTVFRNPRSLVLPDTYGISSAGAELYHYWDENINQTRNTPSIHWKRNIEMPVNMSDYIITSASLEVVFNATVEVTPHAISGSGIDRDGDDGLDAYAIGDFAKFYILISDIGNTQEYQIAYYQTIDLGRDDPFTPSIADKILDSVPEEVLISLLSAVLSEDNYNFTITMGIDIYCEDNEIGADDDEWTSLLFKSLNLTFSYQKKIDKFTSLSWNQIGNTISGSNIDIKNATLNFRYKIDNAWTEESPNSELRFFINNNQYPETIKLSTATSIFQDAKVGGFDVTNLILKGVNITLSIQLYLADTFPLDQEFTLSIDNASLLISYTENTVEDTTSLDIFLNDYNKTLEKSVEVTMGNDVNVTVMYKDSVDSFIPGATVSLLGDGGPRVMNENLTFNQYSVIFSSTELSLGNNFLTIEASKKYYESKSELINIKVIERNTELLLFLDEEDKTLDKSIQMIYGNDGNITITYKDIEQLPGTHIDNATVELIGIGNPQNLTEDLSNEQYFIFIDTKDLGLGNSFLTVNAYKENYTTQSIRFKIEVLERNSYIDNINLNGIETTSIEISWNEILSISVSHNDSFTNDFISESSVQLTGTGISENFTDNSPIDYTLNINTASLELGINFLTISANKENYTLSSRIISISVTERDTKIDVFLNGTLSSNFEFYNLTFGEKLNITVIYKDLNTDTFINSANVRLIESGISKDLTESVTFNQYNITIFSDDLGIGVHSLSLYAKQDNYSIALESVVITVNERDTYLEISLNAIETTAIEIPYGEPLNLTGVYKDSTGYFIDGAVLQLKDGAIIIGNLVKHPTYDQYNLTLISSILGLGVHALTVYAKQDNYSIALESVVITVNERDTYLEISLNAIETTAIEIPYGEPLNLTGIYKDSTGYFINGAVVQLKDGVIIIGNLVKHPTYDQYNLTLNSSILGLGVHSLTVYAKQDNYSIALNSIIISVVQRDTFIDEIYLNNIDKTTDKSIILTSGELLNITLKYKDSITSNFISGALSTITGGGLSGGLSENFVFNHYYRVINSSVFDLGANFLTISLEAGNYSAEAVSLTIFVSERGSVADVFLNDYQRPENYIIVEVWQSINITIMYDDLITGNHLPNATVELLGIGNLTESLLFEQYTIIIDAGVLGQGIDILNIIARKENYESQPLQITVEIIERITDLHLYMNGVNKTIDKFIELPIGSQINFTIDYFDSTGQFVSGALVQLLGEGLSLNLTENITFNHYSITISTNQLDVGIRLLTIIAFKNNYQIQTIDIRLDVQRIKTNINTTSGESVINLSPGETASLEIILYDLDFGGTIKNATVSFTWSGGSGTLIDANDDGIYETVLSDIPDGSHTITISAYAGDDYSFERYEVVITVIRPAEDVLLFIILLIVSSIATVSALTYLYLYQKIFKYPKPVRKVRKYNKTLRKTQNPRVDITAREKAFKAEYQNELNKSSKLLKGKPAEVTSIPDKMLKKPIEGSDK